ncbi:hypothetical protein PIB30_029087 [Stylosanthes scabra]|uniref:Uncharacterized protein n=1 Tax=Stylosanthes scabra TaxID=79078 RepID=A0ABU6TCA1_9FABA|nr:hypothetical protein [Stylosanthes scabra]
MIGRFFKIFPTGEHRPFWLSLEGQGRFSPYWSWDAGMEYVPVTYKGLTPDQKDTADILVKLFTEWNLKPKSVLGNLSEAREAIALTTSPSAKPFRFYTGCFCSSPGDFEPIHEVSSPLHEEVPPSSPSHSKKRQAADASVDPKMPRVSEGTTREFCSMDRSFDASSFIESYLLGPRAQEVLRDYDPMESIRWAEWASLRAATIMKNIEPRLTAADQWENRCVKLNGDLKALNLLKIEAEKAKAERARLKAEGDLKSASDNLKVLEEEKSQEVECWKDRETELGREIQDLQKLVSDEKARADKAEASLVESERTHEELVQMAQDSVAATERALKAQISLLLPDFNVSQLGAFKVIIDGKIVDLPE